MTSRRAEAKALIHAALEQPAAQRVAFVDAVCGVDLELRAEVERLFAAHDQATILPEQPAVTDSQGGASRLSPGTALGPYEIVAFIGAGGMGEVYRARDPRLKRDVAIKLISPALATNRDRLRRFEQEAQAVAALTHPNILAIPGCCSDSEPARCT